MLEEDIETLLGNTVWTNNNPFNQWFQVIRTHCFGKTADSMPNDVIRFWQDLIADRLGHGPLPWHDRVSHFRALKNRRGRAIYAKHKPIDASRRTYMPMSTSLFDSRAIKHSTIHNLKTSSKARLMPYFPEFPNIKNTPISSRLALGQCYAEVQHSLSRL